MDLEFLIETMDIIGIVSVAVAALSVHHRFLNEHRVDRRVFATMKREQVLGISGVFLMITSYALRIYFL
ncbi:hypothetical protein A3A20_02090 [Candidatus Wolfebacteria bacterium RIFCSPLOWO2_01_FULL_45_19]|uniref:Uncharacterized protein n=1 Tax=Candidatus Wolfebacteria bacterium RIFCSPLOWO2_01_FULL_45_19 TaxID=1802557 RepID=A0A1F8DST7_9BACT|nr:MAG: hypothetical protein A3A20_02090 [Candidatus Wolfebacteria bacterium RIFCSPLOWO2_01_FULL_45_19]